MEDLNEKLCKLMLLVSAIVVGVALLWSVISCDVGASSYPTAGITKYLGELVSNSLQADTEEHEVNVVREYEFVDDTRQDITENDIELLAMLITAEEGYADDFEIGTQAYNNILENYYLCGSVVINRINSEEFPATLNEVIFQRGQYACVTNGHINKPYSDIAWEVAEELLVYGTEIPSNIVFQSQFRQGSGLYKQVGNQLYCYR